MKPQWETAISRVLDGKVLIRGYSHEALIGQKSFAAGMYLTLFGELPSASEERMTEAMLSCLLDHGFVAAHVLTARYCASGNPQVVPAAAAGLLTAGRNTISPEHAALFIERAHARMQADGLSMAEAASLVAREEAASGARIPGFGHPTHKGTDFRAVKLWEIADELGFVGERTRLYRAIHDAFVRLTNRPQLCVNVDGALACVMTEMGLRPRQMVAIALVAILPGILAHVLEEIDEGDPLRIVRDENQRYTGQLERPVPLSMDEPARSDA